MNMFLPVILDGIAFIVGVFVIEKGVLLSAE